MRGTRRGGLLLLPGKHWLPGPAPPFARIKLPSPWFPPSQPGVALPSLRGGEGPNSETMGGRECQGASTPCLPPSASHTAANS